MIWTLGYLPDPIACYSPLHSLCCSQNGHFPIPLMHQIFPYLRVSVLALPPALNALLPDSLPGCSSTFISLLLKCDLLNETFPGHLVFTSKHSTVYLLNFFLWHLRWAYLLYTLAVDLAYHLTPVLEWKLLENREFSLFCSCSLLHTQYLDHFCPMVGVQQICEWINEWMIKWMNKWMNE